MEQNYPHYINYCQANKRTILRLSSRRSKTHFNSFVVIIGRCLLRHLSNSRVLCEHVAFSSLRSHHDQDFKIIVNIFRREVLISDGRAKKLIKVQGIRASIFVLRKRRRNSFFFVQVRGILVNFTDINSSVELVT